MKSSHCGICHASIGISCFVDCQRDSQERLHLGGEVYAQQKDHPLACAALQLWFSQVSGTGRDQLLMLSGRVDKAVGRAVPVALRPVKQCAWLHQRATALLGSAIGAVRLRWRGSWRIALRLSLGADARHLLVNALLVLRLNVPGPIACSRALRHSLRSRVKGPSTELNVYQSLCKAHAGVPVDNLATINNCKAH